MQKNKEIGKLLKDKFEDFEVSPNDNLWEKISFDLDEKKRKKRILPLYFFPLLAIITLTSIVFYLDSDRIFQKDLKKSVENSNSSKIHKSSTVSQNSNFPNDQLKQSATKEGIVNESPGKIKSPKNTNQSNKISRNINAPSTIKTHVNKSALSKSSKTAIVSKQLKDSLNPVKKNLISKGTNLSSVDFDKISTSTKKSKKYSRTIKVIKVSNTKTEIEVIEKYILTIDKTKQKPIVKKSTVLTTSHAALKKSPTVKSKKPFKYVKKDIRFNKKKNSHIQNRKKVSPKKIDSISNPISKNDFEDHHKNIEILEKVEKNGEGQTIPKDSIAKKETKLIEKKKSTKNGTKKVTKKGKNEYVEDFTIHFGIQPTIGVNLIGNYKNSSLIGSNFNNQNSHSKLTFSYGLYFLCNTSDKFTLRTGIMKNRIVTETDLTNFSGRFSDVDFAANFNFNLLSNYNGSKIKQEIDYYEFPIEALYTFKEYDDFYLDFVLGTSLNFKKSDKLTYITSDNKEYLFGKSNKISDVNCSLNIGLNAKYELNDHISIVINPMFRSLLGIPKDNFFNTYQLSLQTGLLYKF